MKGAVDLLFSIDLESYTHVFYQDKSSEERKFIDNGWIVESTNNILAELSKYNKSITFFVVGEIFEWHPELIEKIESLGHEIAWHSHTHRLIKNKSILEEELSLSRSFIEKHNIVGFRAPQIYLTQESFECMAQKGFLYDSSRYGEEIIKSSGVISIPVTTNVYLNYKPTYPNRMSLKMLTKEIPVGSGLFLGLFGSRVLPKPNERGLFTCLMHPWQITGYTLDRMDYLKYLMKDKLFVLYLNKNTEVFREILTRYNIFKYRDFINSL